MFLGISLSSKAISNQPAGETRSLAEHIAIRIGILRPRSSGVKGPNKARRTATNSRQSQALPPFLGLARFSHSIIRAPKAVAIMPGLDLTRWDNGRAPIFALIAACRRAYASY